MSQEIQKKLNLPYGLNQFDLSGRVALVTGGATGIGVCLAKGLAGAGASVFIVSRNVDRLKEAVQEIIAATGNPRVAYGQADFANRKETEGVVGQVLAKFGRLDILIGNAAIDILEPIDSFKDASMDQLLEVNLTSNIVLLRSAVPELKKNGWGRVVFISSIAAITGNNTGLSVYGTAKSGLHAFAKMTAFELGGDGITVNCIAPGYTLTPMLEGFIESIGEAGRLKKEASAKTTAMNRWGRPEEMVGPVLLFASDAGSFLTGTVLVVDGGTSIHLG